MIILLYYFIGSIILESIHDIQKINKECNKYD